MAVYLVEGPEGTKPRLVSTRTQVAAIAHVSQSMFKATPLSAKELVPHIKAGLDVEELEAKPKKAKEEPLPGTQELPAPVGKPAEDAAADKPAEETKTEETEEKIPGFARRRR